MLILTLELYEHKESKQKCIGCNNYEWTASSFPLSSFTNEELILNEFCLVNCNV